MADFTFITSRIATGAAISSADDVAQLVAAGVTHVIDCAAELMATDGALLSAEPGFVYLPNGVLDDGQSKPPAWFGHSIEFALDALATPGHRVYSHCAAGVNRGPSTAYAILRSLGISAASAEAMIRAVRPQVGLAYKADADAAVTALGYE